MRPVLVSLPGPSSETFDVEARSLAVTIGPMTTKEQLHKLVDELSEQEAAAALVIVERRRDDPSDHASRTT
jgi:hypothetical protein